MAPHRAEMPCFLAGVIGQNESVSQRIFTGYFKAHEGVVRGCSYVPGGSHILTCADDKTIKLWDANKWSDVPVDTIVSKHMVS